MDTSVVHFPCREEGLALHLQLCDQNPVAVAEVCRSYLDALLAWSDGRFAGIDPHLRQTAVHDALMAYVQAPRSYDPNRGDLASYLRMATRWDLANLLKRDRRHYQGRVAWEFVEDKTEEGNLLGAEEPSLQVERDEEAQKWQAFLQKLGESFTEEERRVLHLLLACERKTEVYARALGIGTQPVAEQEREVKKVKDRIKKRLERGGRDHA